MKLLFHGAAQTVTGSMHEVQAAGKRILLDCGSFQGRRDLARQINGELDVPPGSVDAVVLSHGHADHCGNLPTLVKQGYRGPIYATPATAAVAALIMMDSAKIQEEDAAYLNQKTLKTWQGKIEPLYTQEDAGRTIGLFKPLGYRTPQDLGGFTVELREAGHVLGSTAIRVQESSGGKAVVFSGDVGRPDSPVLRDPEPFTQTDAFITECTYGGRRHVAVREAIETVRRVIQETTSHNGWVIIPSFALGRTQALVEQIHLMRDSGRLPRTLPIYVDSPLATRITEVFRNNPGLFDAEAQALVEPFDFPNLHYVQSIQESMALNARAANGGGVIIASSGMCEGGRVLHHLKHHIADPGTTVLLAGYQADNTLGRKIQDHWREVPILGDMIPLRARVEMIDGLSAHADSAELLAYTRPLLACQPKVFLVHGETDGLAAHQRDLTAAGFTAVTVVKRGDVFEV